MSMNNLLADVLTRIRNGQKAKHDFVIAHTSKFVESCLSILRAEGYIKDYDVFEERKGVRFVRIDLKYYRGQPVIQSLKVLSKPGCRVYKGLNEIFRSHNGFGTYVFSTSKGILSDQSAKMQNVGGELLFEVF